MVHFGILPTIYFGGCLNSLAGPALAPGAPGTHSAQDCCRSTPPPLSPFPSCCPPFLCFFFFLLYHCHTPCWPGLRHGVRRAPPYSRDPPHLARGHHLKNCPHPSSEFTGCRHYLIPAWIIPWSLVLGACTVWKEHLRPPPPPLACLPACLARPRQVSGPTQELFLEKLSRQ